MLDRGGFSRPVYPPPPRRRDLPHIAVILDPKGKVIFAQAVGSRKQGDVLLTRIVQGMKKLADDKK